MGVRAEQAQETVRTLGNPRVQGQGAGSGADE